MINLTHITPLMLTGILLSSVYGLEASAEGGVQLVQEKAMSQEDQQIVEDVLEKANRGEALNPSEQAIYDAAGAVAVDQQAIMEKGGVEQAFSEKGQQPDGGQEPALSKDDLKEHLQEINESDLPEEQKVEEAKSLIEESGLSETDVKEAVEQGAQEYGGGQPAAEAQQPEGGDQPPAPEGEAMAPEADQPPAPEGEAMAPEADQPPAPMME